MYLLRRSFHSILLTGLLLLGAATAANDSNAYAVSLLAAMQVFGITTSDVCTATGITCTGGFVTGIKLDAYPSMTTNFRKIPDHTTDPFYTYSYEEMTITSIKCARCVYVEGSLPAAWSRIKTLTSISFNDCRLTGTLPVAWSAFTALKELRLDSNKVTGTLPLGWSSITSLQSLRVGGNQITGTLPPEWKSMSNLEELDLHSNQLTGTLPPEWKSMNNLQRLDLFRNQLTGTLPAQWSIMPRLRTLFLDSNQLSGCIPESYTSQKIPSLSDIALENNPQLTGCVPPSWRDPQDNLYSSYTSLTRLNASLASENCTPCSDETTKSVLSTGAIVGIVVGCVVVALVILFLVIFLCCRRKHKVDAKHAAAATEEAGGYAAPSCAPIAENSEAANSFLISSGEDEGPLSSGSEELSNSCYSY